MTVSLLYFLAFGSLAGVLAGLLGIGGGMVIVPFLLWRLTVDHHPEDSVMIEAVATSLATIVMTSVSAVYAHHRLGAVRWPLVWRITPGIVVGAALGSVIAEALPGTWLKLLFAVYLLVVAARMLLRSAHGDAWMWRPSGIGYAAAGGVIGAVASILGIGGGTMSVPFLARCGQPMANAVAISNALGFPIALAGTASYIYLGLSRTDLPDWSLGYVYLPALGGIIVTSTACAPLGAWLAHRLPAAGLKTVFAVVLIAIGGKLLWQVAGSAMFGA